MGTWGSACPGFPKESSGEQRWEAGGVHRARDTVILKGWVRNFVREGGRAKGVR